MLIVKLYRIVQGCQTCGPLKVFDAAHCLFQVFRYIFQNVSKRFPKMSSASLLSTHLRRKSTNHSLIQN